jgi:hypothetical protein
LASAAHRRCGAIALVLAGIAGCAFPEYGFPGDVPDDSGVDATVDAADVADADGGAPPDSAIDASDGPADADTLDDADAAIDASDGAEIGSPSCPGGKTGQDLCTVIPPDPGGTIEIDGKGDELCSLSALRFDSTASEWLDPDPLPTWAKNSRADIRLAWVSGTTAATAGLHLHAFVADPIHHVAASTDPVFDGAVLVVYLAGYDTLTGAYDGTTSDVGAGAFELPPPGYATPDRAVMAYGGTQKGFAGSAVSFATRLVTGGYEVEARIAWSELAPGKPLPATGTKVGLDFTLRVRDAGTQVVTLHHKVATVTGSSPCVVDRLPMCDDRTWCKPRLGP